MRKRTLWLLGLLVQDWQGSGLRRPKPAGTSEPWWHGDVHLYIPSPSSQETQVRLLVHDLGAQVQRRAAAGLCQVMPFMRGHFGKGCRGKVLDQKPLHPFRGHALEGSLQGSPSSRIQRETPIWERKLGSTVEGAWVIGLGTCPASYQHLTPPISYTQLHLIPSNSSDLVSRIPKPQASEAALDEAVQAARLGRRRCRNPQGGGLHLCVTLLTLNSMAGLKECFTEPHNRISFFTKNPQPLMKIHVHPRPQTPNPAMLKLLDFVELVFPLTRSSPPTP